MTMLPDMRENASGIPAILANEYGIKVVPACLKTGDYIINEEIAVERKTAVDFAQSIMDGRLFKQAAAIDHAFLNSGFSKILTVFPSPLIIFFMCEHASQENFTGLKCITAIRNKGWNSGLLCFPPK